MFCFDQANGNLIWERKVSPSVIDGQLILGEGNELIVHSNDFKVYMIDKKSGAPIWKASVSDSNPNRIKVGTPAVTEDGQIYVINAENELVSLSTKDGSKNWSVAVNGNVNKTVTVGDDGTIYLVGSGNVHAFQGTSGPPKDAPWPMFQQNRRNSGNAYDGKEEELKSKPQTGFVQHLITDKIPGITNILAEDIDQDGDMDIITADVGGIGILKYDGILRTQRSDLVDMSLLNMESAN